MRLTKSGSDLEFDPEARLKNKTDPTEMLWSGYNTKFAGLLHKQIWYIVLILDGNSKKYAHVNSNLCYLICLRHGGTMVSVNLKFKNLKKLDMKNIDMKFYLFTVWSIVITLNTSILFNVYSIISLIWHAPILDT